MNADDLDRPLGFVPSSEGVATHSLRDIPWGAWALGGMGVLATSLAAFPYVMERFTPPPAHLSTSLEPMPPKRIAVSDVTAPSDADSHIVTGGVRIITPSQDQESGVKIIRRQAGDHGEALVIRVPPDMKPMGLAPAPDARLIMAGPYGPLPRVAKDGLRPLDVYARPIHAASALPPSAPRLALVVIGLGPDAQASILAMTTLPPTITLVLSSQIMGLEEQAEQARLAGHEWLLQVPMEGEATSEDFASRTLKTNMSREKNLDALHWHMSRASGYIGVTHAQGGRLMARSASLSPILQDIAERGLMFFDDGSLPQAMTSAVALATATPSLRADLVVDLMAKAQGPESALGRLETLARDKGNAIGAVRIHPSAIDRLARFAQGLEARGIALVPLSALLPASARTVAR